MSTPGSWRSEARHLLPLAAILVALVWSTYSWVAEYPVSTWLLSLVLIGAFVVVIGHAVTGSWRGVLIDARNKISLSRLQILAWTLIVLSTVLVIGIFNVRLEGGWESPLSFAIPPDLWILMGISTTSAVASPALLATARTQASADPEQVKEAVARMKADGYLARIIHERTKRGRGDAHRFGPHGPRSEEA